MKTPPRDEHLVAANTPRAERAALLDRPGCVGRHLCFALCGLFAALAAPAHALKPDITFGSQGLADVHAERDGTLGESLKDVIVDAQGRYVAAGEESRIAIGYKTGLIVRRMPDGSPDLSFAGVGHTYLEWQGFGVGIVSVAEQPEDGKLVVGGNLYPANPAVPFDANWLSQPAVVCRLHPQGELDLQFGNDGCYRLADIGGRPVMQYAVSVALQGNHIVVLGDAIADDGDPRSFALARLGPNGFPDFSFGDPNIGGAVCPVAQMPRCATALSPAIASDLIHPVKLRVDPNEDRLVVAGEDASHEVAYLLRYTGDGDIDKVFPQVDFETIEGNPGRDIPNDFLILPDGAVVLTARVMTYSPNDPAPDIVQRLGIVKFTSEGLFDTKFSSSGMATYDLGPNNGQHPSRTGLSVARQGNGKFLIATSVKYGTLGSTVCRLLRIDSEGIEDPTLVDFGYPGVRDLPALNSEILSNDDADTTLFCTANRIIVDQDTIVVAGESMFSTTASTSSQDAFFYRLEERSLFSDEFENSL